MALALVLASSQTHAQPVSGGPSSSESSEAETKLPMGGWSFTAAPYLWLPEIQGTVTAGRLSAPVNVDFDRLFDLIFDGKLLAGGMHLGAQWKRISLFFDAFGGGARPSQQTERGKTNMDLNFAFVEFGPAYRLLEWPSDKPGGRPIQLDALVGGRFMYFFDEITLVGSGGRINESADATTTWVDPFVGGRWNVPLVGDLDLVFRGDIGGFGAGSQLAWNLIGGFQYWLPWTIGHARMNAVAAYKAFDFDYESSSGRRRVDLELDMRGPLLGVMFFF
jgi:hypothetical protein